MKFRRLYLGLLTVVLFILSACGDVEAGKKETAKSNSAEQSAEEKISYENEEYHISVHNAEDWKVDEIENEDKLIVNFQKDNMEAIITVVTTDKKLPEIKNEFLLGAGDSEIIKDKEGQLSYRSKLENSMRTDIFLEKHEKFTYVFTFITPDRDYEKLKGSIDALMKNIKIEE